MLRRVVSGGQTGVDQAAWRAARRAGLQTGGVMPRGFMTEDGPRPEFAGYYGAVEDDSPDERIRTIRNVEAGDATLVLLRGSPGPGTVLTIETSRRLSRPHRCVDPESAATGELVAWVMAGGFETLNVAGDRESVSPGIGAIAEGFLCRLFDELVAQ